MAKTKKQQEEEIVDVQKVYMQTEEFVNKYKVPGLIGIGVIVAVVLGTFYYYNMYLPPLEQEAQDELFHAQRHFSNDSLNLAMFGDREGNLGFEDIAGSYSGTNAGNLANYYMGVSLLRTGDFEGAILYLNRYKPKDIITPSIKFGAMGDAYSELGDYDKALDLYKKAANQSKNNFTTPVYLMKAATVAEYLNKHKVALDFYQTIKDDYPNSEQARNIEKYIVRAENRK